VAGTVALEFRMAKSLLVSPPFTKEEWAEADMECLADSPLGERLVDYLCLYTHALLKQGQERLEGLLETAGIPADSKEPITLPQVRRVVSGLVAGRRRFSVGYLEQLLAVNVFVDHATGAGAIRLDGRTQEKTRKCKELALRVLFACIDDHVGFMSDEEPPRK
jgi:hypothetical protein